MSISFNHGEHFMTRFGDRHVVLDARAPATFGNVDSRLDRDHHARLEPGGFSRANQKSRVVIAKVNVVAGVVGEESRESLVGNLVPCQRVNVAGGSTWTYGSDCGLLGIPDNREHLRNITPRD